MTMTLTKAELADMLFEQVGLNKREAKDMVECFFEEIRLALERGDCVKLSGQNRRRDSDYGPACGDFSCQPKAQGQCGATERCRQVNPRQS